MTSPSQTSPEPNFSIPHDRNQTGRPHPEEAALFARPSRRMAAGTISPVAVFSKRAQERAPQDEADG